VRTFTTSTIGAPTGRTIRAGNRTATGTGIGRWCTGIPPAPTRITAIRDEQLSLATLAV
jgi:hypothetical protein